MSVLSKNSASHNGNIKNIKLQIQGFLQQHLGLNPTQSMAAFGALTFMGLVYYVGVMYETSKLYDLTLPLNQEICPNLIRAGDAEDGGWWMCSDQSVPASNCVVYSFGINDNFSFDHYLAQKGCEVHGFDPSPYGLKSKDAYEKVPNAHYHSYGLGFKDKLYGVDEVPFRWPGLGYLSEGNTAQWQLYTLPTITNQLLKHPQGLSVLKVDIEGGEWDTFDDIIHTDWQELYMELHFPPAQYSVSKTDTGGLYLKRTPFARPPSDVKGANYPAHNSPGRIDRIHILKRLQEVADVFHWNNNNNCQPAFTAECVEIYFKRKAPVKGAAKRLGGQIFGEPPNKWHLVD